MASSNIKTAFSQTGNVKFRESLINEEVKSPSKRVSIIDKNGIKFPTDEPSEESDDDDENESDETSDPTSRNDGSARRHDEEET